MRLFPCTAIRWLLPALAIASLAGAPAHAQSSMPSAGMIAPGGANVFGPSSMLGSPGDSILRPGGAAIPPIVPTGQVALSLSASFGKEAGPIGAGLDWRVYAAKAEVGG